MLTETLIQIQMIKIKKNIDIAIVGLGQIGIYLYNELNNKKKRY